MVGSVENHFHIKHNLGYVRFSLGFDNYHYLKTSVYRIRTAVNIISKQAVAEVVPSSGSSKIIFSIFVVGWVGVGEVKIKANQSQSRV